MSAPAPMLPLPMLELLDELRAQGLQVSVREHLSLGRLLDHWDEIDPATLRSALASLLARNTTEVRIVRETFDRLYVSPPPPPPPLLPPSRIGMVAARARDSILRRWFVWLLVAASLAGVGVVVHRIATFRPPDSVPVEPPKPTIPDKTPTPPEPVLPTPPRPIDWRRALALAGIGGAGVFLALYIARTRHQAVRLARESWRDELDARSGPQTYDLVLGDLTPRFRPDLLDDLASVLGRRRSAAPQGDDLDVDRTLERTLRAGLAPQIVLRSRVTSEAILVLVDLAPDMAVHRKPIDALLQGLQSRGVPLDVRYFDADASRVFRRVDGPAIGLRQLQRLRSEAPLVVVSAGAGLLTGERFQLADWIEILKSWRSRVWVHPSTDVAAWRPALARVWMDVWPMSPEGLMAASRELSRGDRRMPSIRDALPESDRPVTPLDVDRLRWLLSMAPRKDPALAELLRQKFCPFVPIAAVPQALAAPVLPAHPGVGPSQADVRSFLLEVLDDSRPATGTVAWERWRLDRAVQELQLAEGKLASRATLEDVAALAAGPLATEVEDALQPLAAGHPEVKTAVEPIRRRAAAEGLSVGRVSGARHWVLPRFGECATFLVIASVLLLMAPWLGRLVRDEVPRSYWSYELALLDPDPGRAAASLALTIKEAVRSDRSKAPVDVELYRSTGGQKAASKDRNVKAFPEETASIPLSEWERGSWYYVSARLPSGAVGLSERVAFPAIQRLPAATRRITIRFVDEAGAAVPGVRFQLGASGRASASPITGVTPAKPEALASLQVPPGPYDLTADPPEPYAMFQQRIVVSQFISASSEEEAPLPFEFTLTRAPERLPIVPDVMGKTVDVAERALKKAGFVMGVRTLGAFGRNLNSPGLSVEVVVSQSPSGGTRAPAGSSVALVLGEARDNPSPVQGPTDANADDTKDAVPGEVRVPDVGGRTQDEARKELAGVGLVADVSGDISSADTTVVSQDPPAGTMVRRGASVRLQLQQRDRTGTLEITEFPQGVDTNTLAIGSRSWDGGPVRLPPGQVEVTLLKGPFPFSKAVTIVAGQTTQLRVAPDEQTVRVPNVLGLTIVAAQRELESVSLRVVTDQFGTKEDIPNAPGPGSTDRVVAQSPEGGRLVDRGAVVRLTLRADKRASPSQKSADVVDRYSPEQNPNWGCEEDRDVEVTYRLGIGEEFVSASVEVTNVSNAKSQNTTQATYERSSGVVRAHAMFRGLDRVLGINCPGGGNATVRLRVTVRLVRASSPAQKK